MNGSAESQTKHQLKVYFPSELCPEFRSKALYAFEEIFWRFGISILLVTVVSDADIIYTQSQTLSDKVQKRPQVWVRVEPQLYEKRSCGRLSNVSLESITKQVLKLEIDPVGWVYRFLTLADESSTTPSRSDGNKYLSELPSWRKSIAHLPVVEYLCLGLVKLLRSQGITFKNKIGFEDYKLLLTHDTDATNSSNILEIIYDLSKASLRLNASFFKRACSSITYINKPYELNPTFGFEQWIAALPKFKHTFFLSYRGVSPSHLNDVRSSTSDSRFPWPVLKRMANYRDIEFGLHPGIRTKEKQKYYTELKTIVERSLAVPINGLRHHYWSLDWNNPNFSFRKMVNSGLRYDCSIAYPDSIGLRSGTCLPYRPFDPQYCRPLNIFLIPTCAMDAWSLDISSGITSKMKTMLSEIKRVRGVINLDWHTESAMNIFPYEGYLDALKILISDNGFHHNNSALPSDLIKTWHNKVDSLANLYPHLDLKLR